jgi:hypothetical protein
MPGTQSFNDPLLPNLVSNYRFTVLDLLTVIPDNTGNEIDAKDIRDSVWTLWNRIDDVQLMASQSLSNDNSYARNTPMPISVGGATIGTTFSGTIQDALDKILYPYVSQSNSLSVSSGSTRQFGSSTSVILSWGVTKNSNNIQSIVVDSQSFVPTGTTQVGTKSTTGTHSQTPGISETNTYSMVTYDGISTRTAYTTVTWMNNRYWGYIDLSSLGISDISLSGSYPAQVGSFINDVRIKNLNGAGSGTGKELATSIAKTLVDMDGGGKHLCFAWPTSFGSPRFVIGGLTNTAFTKVRENSPFGNEFGFSGTKYDVWVSNTAYNSKTTVIISS